ncbi:DUF2780 domain-containing protein [Photobacterium lipolyticum]|uniref:DUF2780 domain-containing protein n=1 Tax=Photobacterium lipolyticum TaxID=266810 RepID=A0A2T3MS49_9GAMM|nr:DUF2780 domain-containing protein [Photobacterium lipolyticum]PSW00450.1 hypothetical protein C9I89_20990 [Photobacterium lipolyticum]
MDKVQLPRRFFSLFTLICILAASPSSFAFSFSDLFGGDDEQAATTTSTTANPLTDLLSGQLGVSPEQAAGGAGALLSMATSQLSGDQASELTQMIPGVDALTNAIPPGLSGMLSTMNGLNQVFAALGMDASMVSQFIPVVMQYLGDQGASAGLMETLGQVWGSTS